MPIRTFKPITSTLRFKTAHTFSQLTGDPAHKPLLVAKKRSSGRNNSGRITNRHRGGGSRRHRRIVDYRRNKVGVPGTVETIEYDPNRSSFVALLKYADGERRYILATVNMKQGMRIVSSDVCEIAEGNCMQLRNIPLGTMVHNVELMLGRGGQVARGGGAYAEIVAKEGAMVQLRFPSGEVRNVRENCKATIGQVSNPEHMNIVLGSAGRGRWLGRRPSVRGVAMNPVDHPMGGGEGRSKSGGGWQHPVSPWGQPAKGFKTRRKNKTSSKYIVRRRKKKKAKKR